MTGRESAGDPPFSFLPFFPLAPGVQVSVGDIVRRLLFMAGCVVVLLVGCKPSDDSASAKSSDPMDLMRVAVPGWEAEGRQSVQEFAAPVQSAGQGAKTEVSSYALAPSLVLKQDEDKIVLITVGTPANEQGVPQSSHASSAILGAYWFEKRSERWFKVAEQPGFAEEGFFGQVGDLRQVDLGGGTFALAVENGSCWQGSCGKWLTLYVLGEKQIVKVFRDIIASDSENAVGNCGELMMLDAGQQRRMALDDYSGASGCYRIDGRLSILPASNGLGQLVIDFSGKTTSKELVPIPAAKAASAGQDEFADDDPKEEYLVTVVPLEQRQAYTFRAGRYVLTEGENPNPRL